MNTETMLAAYGLDVRQRSCYDTHGFWYGQGIGGNLFLFIPSGSTDPSDGMPLVYAKRCSPAEVWLLNNDREADLAARLHAGGMPVRAAAASRRRWWQRLKAWWRRVMG